MKIILRSFLLLALGLPALLLAQPSLEQVEKTMIQVFETKPDFIGVSPVAGLYEVRIAGQIFYVTADGSHLLNGELFSIKERINLTERSRGESRLDFIKSLDEKELIQYPARGEEKHVITVFTDIDCGYCRRMHRGMKEMNELGITVRYMAFARSAVGSASYNKLVGVWCSKDRNTAMDKAKLQGELSEQLCENNPVAKHMEIGQALGVRGTPALLLQNGVLLPGYLPPQQLLEELDKRS
jgi:thiol:disulfide interchange protein DsbC